MLPVFVEGGRFDGGVDDAGGGAADWWSSHVVDVVRDRNNYRRNP